MYLIRFLERFKLSLDLETAAVVLSGFSCLPRPMGALTSDTVILSTPERDVAACLILSELSNISLFVAAWNFFDGADS